MPNGRLVFGIFAQIGLGLPVLISWRETDQLANLCAIRYRRKYSAVFIYKIWMLKNEPDLPRNPAE
jgi:hypothetical protein